MENNDVTPIYKPGHGLLDSSEFLTNVNDSVSLWRCNNLLRIYGGDGRGWWVRVEANGPCIPNMREDNDAARNVLANKTEVLLYAAMLERG